MPQAQDDIPQVPGRSFLTNTQRRYLFGEDFPSERERQLRYHIRKNFQSALMDFQLINFLNIRDQILATNPLSAFYEFEKVDSREVENHMDEISDIEIQEGDKEIGGLMHEGFAELMAFYIQLYGPDVFEHIAQEAINQATVTEAIDRDDYIGYYNVEINHME